MADVEPIFAETSSPFAVDIDSLPFATGGESGGESGGEPGGVSGGAGGATIKSGAAEADGKFRAMGPAALCDHNDVTADGNLRLPL